MADGLERLNYAWGRADGEARRAFLLERYREQAGSGEGEREINITSQVNSRDGSPAVLFRWGERQVTMTATEAKQHALAIFEVATGAEADAFLVAYVHTRIGAPMDQAAAILQDFRVWREELAQRQSTEG